jgi:DNA-binding beta-propeller fold protein YncE
VRGACDPLIGTTAVGPAPVGIAAFGKSVLTTSSNRFAQPSDPQTIVMVDAQQRTVTGSVMVGAFPREIAVDATGIFVSNYNSSSLTGLDAVKLGL